MTKVIEVPQALLNVEDDLTILTKAALVKKMREEGNDLLDDKEAMKALDAQAKTGDGIPVTEALKALHRQFRGLAKGNDGPAPNTNGSVVEARIVVAAMPAHELGRDFFVCKMKYRDLVKLAPDAEAQRPVSKRRIPEISQYVAQNDGWFPPLMVTAIGPDSDIYYDGDENFGYLTISGIAKALIGDGQHKWYGIEDFLNSAEADVLEERLDDDRPMNVYVNQALPERRQMFADVNMNAKKPPRAISDSYDERNLARRFAHDLVKSSATFRGKTNFVKTRIGAKDSESYTFSNVVDIVAAMFDDLSDATYGRHLAEAVEFWREFDEAVGALVEAKSTILNHKNALVATAKLFGSHIDWKKFAALDWKVGGELDRVVGEAGGSNAAMKALFDSIKYQVKVGE